MARLLATEIEVAAQHLLEHVAVADLRLHHGDAHVAHRELEAEVAHVRRDERAAGETPLLHHLARGDRQHRVAVDQLPALVDEEATVAVAVERDANVGALLDHRGLERRRHLPLPRDQGFDLSR